MADFRKWFSVLAVVALMVGFGVTASAQTVTCNASAGSPPILRAEGYTELAGDILLTCSTPTVPPAGFTFNVTLFANTNITSRLLTTATSTAQGNTGAANLTEALMLVSYAPNGTIAVPDILPTAVVPQGTAGANAFHAVKTSDSSIVWAGVPLTPPGTNFTVRLTNIRVNATTVTPVGNFPGQVSAFLAISGTQSFVVNNTTQTIGAVQNGLGFAARKCDDSGGASANFNQCKGEAGDLLSTDPTKSASAQFAVKFSEQFAYAFKPGLAPGQDTPGSIAGTTYNSESGYVNPILGSESGYATFGFVSQTGTTFSQTRMGTRVIARFSNIPAGVTLYVSTQPCTLPGKPGVPGLNNTSAGTAPSTGSVPLCGSDTIWAQLLQGTDAAGNGGTPATITSSNVSCSNIKGLSVSQIAVDPVANTATAVWEVIGANPAVAESILAQVVVKTSVSLTANPPTPGLGTATVYGTFGPAYATGTGADKSSSTLPVPRFVDTPKTNTAFNINACQTTLLFPFVTTVPGFDTGIAIANTSLDPFNRKSDGTFDPKNSNQGACSIYMWQNGAFTGADAKTGFATPVVPAGSVLTFSLFNGIPLSDGTTKSVAGFNGYMIAQCQFLYAHGFAFISDLGAQKLAQGYLALVMFSNGDRTSSVGENLNN